MRNKHLYARLLRILKDIGLGMKANCTSLSLLLLAALTGMIGGCNGGPTAVFEKLSPPTPAQEARNVFNVYDPDVRRKALNNLSASPFGGEGPYVRLYRLLIDDPDPTVRSSAVKALGLHGEPQDVPLLTIRLSDEADMVRWEAAKSLQKIHNPAAIKPLLRSLAKDKDPDVRMACADALGQYATPEVFGSLVSALDDTRHGVVIASKDSLNIITGQNLGIKGTDWLNFREQNPKHLFTNQKVYTWQPYTPPRGFMDKIKFWKQNPGIKPAQSPVGLDEKNS